jgi:hypothetical protein
VEAEVEVEVEVEVEAEVPSEYCPSFLSPDAYCPRQRSKDSAFQLTKKSNHNSPEWSIEVVPVPETAGNPMQRTNHQRTRRRFSAEFRPRSH